MVVSGVAVVAVRSVDRGIVVQRRSRSVATQCARLAGTKPAWFSASSTAALLGLALLCTPAGADEFPRRKAGLWEMKTAGGPVGAQTIQQCIDADTDDLLRSQSNEGQNCSKPVIQQSGSRYRVRSICDSDGIKSTIEGEYIMSGNTRYTGDMRMTFDPPLSGATEMNMKVDGKWLGPCKAGMKPGDTVLQGVPRLNMLEMGKGDDAGAGGTADDARRTEQMQRNMAEKRPVKPQ